MRRGGHFFVLRYLEDEMRGVPRDAFREALRAEGAHVGSGYGRPVYAFPAFLNASFGAKGCPINCGHYGKKIDYAKARMPAAEHACYKEQLTISHRVFLYRENVEKLARAFHKVHENLDELR